jgi:hypothetical protein
MIRGLKVEELSSARGEEQGSHAGGARAESGGENKYRGVVLRSDRGSREVRAVRDRKRGAVATGSERYFGNSENYDSILDFVRRIVPRLTYVDGGSIIIPTRWPD